MSVLPPSVRQDRSESVVASLANGMHSVHLSSPVPATSAPGADGLGSMSALDAAVRTVERGADEQAVPLETPRPATPPPSTDPAMQRALRPPSSASSAQSRPRSRGRRSRGASQTMPYNIETEEMPPHRLYSPAVQRSLRDSESLVANVAAALGSSGSRLHEDQESTVHRLHTQATALANFQFPSSWTVGFAGDTGAGMNSAPFRLRFFCHLQLIHISTTSRKK